MKRRLTEKAIEKLTVPAGKDRTDVADELIPGLILRVGRRRKSWSLIYRVAGKGENGNRGELVRMTLGTWPMVDLKTARDKARQALEAADSGLDPSAQKKADVEHRQTRTFEVILERFVELHVKQNTRDGRFARDRAVALGEAVSGKTVIMGPKKELGRPPAQRLIEDYALPEWRGRLIETITRTEVHDLLDDVLAKKTTSIARELRKHLSKLFNWAADRGYVATSPLFGMRRSDLKYIARERVLSMEELRRIWDAAGKLEYPFGGWVRLLILTGQRKAEIAGLRRGWFDGDSDRLFVIPAAEYKTRREHAVPLSAPAERLIKSLPKWNGGPFLFSTTGGRRPISGFSSAEARLRDKVAEKLSEDGASPMEHWTMHDIRRSVATHMARLGISQEHIERVLGHVVPGIAGTYNKYSYLDEKRAALEAWGKLWKS